MLSSGDGGISKTLMSSWVCEEHRGCCEGEGSVSLWSEGLGEEASQVAFEAERTHQVHNGRRLLLNLGHVDGRAGGWFRSLVATEVRAQAGGLCLSPARQSTQPPRLHFIWPQDISSTINKQQAWRDRAGSVTEGASKNDGDVWKGLEASPPSRAENAYRSSHSYGMSSPSPSFQTWFEKRPQSQA